MVGVCICLFISINFWYFMKVAKARRGEERRGGEKKRRGERSGMCDGHTISEEGRGRVVTESFPCVTHPYIVVYLCWCWIYCCCIIVLY